MAKYKKYFGIIEPIKENETPNSISPICSAELLAVIQQQLKNHEQLVKGHISAGGEYWELILKNSYEALQYECEWRAGSHKSGTDVTVLSPPIKYPEISCKSGEIKVDAITGKPKTLSLSSFRTTRFKTLQEKIEFIGRDHEDIIFSLSSTFLESQNKYVLTILLPPNEIFTRMIWKEMGNGDYYADETEFITAKITQSQSGQLWYNVSYESPLILETHDIYI